MTAPERTSLRVLLRQALYRRLWTARTVSQWGDAFNTVALALLVYSLTGSGLGVSGIVIAEIIPVLVPAPFAGALVDRLPRVRVMISADLARAGLAFLLPFVDSSVVAVYAIAIGLSAGAVFFNPAAQSVVPAIVQERDLVAANSGLWTAAVVSQIVLAPLAGVVVTAFGYSWRSGSTRPAIWFPRLFCTDWRSPPRQPWRALGRPGMPTSVRGSAF